MAFSCRELPGGIARPVYEEQFSANRSSLAHFDTFALHRSRLNRLLCERAPHSGLGSVCLLGAGNCHDVELPELLRTFGSVHLVDLDERAVAGARARVLESERDRVIVHAPIDLSGMLARLGDWQACHLQPEEMIGWSRATAEGIAEGVGQSFDVVASMCVLSQMQLGLVQALGDRHPLFQAARYTLDITHFRTLWRLLTPSGRGILATDVAYDPDRTHRELSDDGDLRPLLRDPTGRTKLIDTTHPELLRQMFLEDPVLRGQAVLSEPIDAWLWHNGPVRTFLVYALELRGSRNRYTTGQNEPRNSGAFRDRE